MLHRSWDPSTYSESPERPGHFGVHPRSVSARTSALQHSKLSNFERPYLRNALFVLETAYLYALTLYHLYALTLYHLGSMSETMQL